jgi:hypothetical protein
MEEIRDDGLPPQIRVHAPHEAGVDLDESGLKLDQVGEVRHPGSGVVDGQTNIGPQPLDRLTQWSVRLDRVVLGDLQDERSGAEAKGRADRRHISQTASTLTCSAVNVNRRRAG